VARQSPGRRNAEEDASGNVADRDEVEDAVEDTDAEDEEAEYAEDDDLDGAEEDDNAEDDNAEDDDAEDEGVAARATADDRPLWRDVRVDPVELALPVGSGYTLRAYRPKGVVTPTEVDGREEEDPFEQRVRLSEEDEDEVVILDEEFEELVGAEDEDVAAEEKEKEEQDEEAEEAAEDEEVPVFLSHRGKLLLFRSAESLVEFVRSGQPNDLAQIDTWAELAERIELADVAPRDEDTYELDLVVENLRGGHDTWDVPLLISAGEIARDLGYALRIAPLIAALAAGSPLDDLDEALRKTADGGLGGFLGRRRLRKIGAQQATLGWRTIIGKISAAVDWRD
jgi:hypothetical protein